MDSNAQSDQGQPSPQQSGGRQHIVERVGVDRLLHRATVINIRGDSYRLKTRQRAGSDRLEIDSNDSAGAALTQGQPRSADEHEEVSA